MNERISWKYFDWLAKYFLFLILCGILIQRPNLILAQNTNNRSMTLISKGNVKHITKNTSSGLSFTDITSTAGITGPTDPGQTGGHSVCFADVDNDGLPDLYITMIYHNPMSDLFFHNIGDNLFIEEANLRGIDDFDGGSHGACFADYDNDGDYDLLNGTTKGATGLSAKNNIYLNDGRGYFIDVTTSSGIPERELPTRGVLAFDMEGDGDLDIFCVTNYQGSDDPPGEFNEIYRNDGNMYFTAIDTGDLYTAPAGQGATATDYDGDGDIDIIAGNRTGPVNMLQNDGYGNFTKILPSSIGITHQGRDGISMSDIDSDGDLDMLLVGDPMGYLYLNQGNGTFVFNREFINTEGYMGGFADLDNDGDLDLVFAGSDVCYLNDGFGNFTTGPNIPVGEFEDPRAIAFADIDNDGDLDFAVACKRSRNLLIRNDFNSGNWLKIKLISSLGQIGAFGAKAYLYPAGQAGGRLLGMRESRSANGYLGQNDPVLHFGLGQHTVVDIVVHFLDGSRGVRFNVPANQILTIKPDEMVTIPATPTGPDSGILGESYSFSTNGAFCNFEHEVDYQFNWGDSTLSYWGDSFGDHCYWSSGSFQIKARARCQIHTDIVSDWSEVHIISITGFKLIVTIDPVRTGNVTINPRKQEYAKNDTVILTAMGETEYSFDHWEGDLQGKFNPVKIIMDCNKNVIAKFTKIPETVSTPDTLSGAEKGFRGQLLTFSASAAESNFGHAVEYQFDWGNENYSDWGNSSQVHIYYTSGDYKVKARARCKSNIEIVSNWSDSLNIEISGCQLNIIVDPENAGGVVQNPQEVDYDYGEEVTLSITTNVGYKFSNWNEDANDTTTSKIIIIYKDTTMTANYKTTSSIIKNQINDLPTRFALCQNYPNPFNPETTINYQLPKNCKVKLTVYNIAGQLIALLVNENKQAGFHSINWNVKDKSGNKAPSGIYFYILEANKFIQVNKMILMK